MTERIAQGLVHVSLGAERRLLPGAAVSIRRVLLCIGAGGASASEERLLLRHLSRLDRLSDDRRPPDGSDA
jgi:hypothetical protein